MSNIKSYKELLQSFITDAIDAVDFETNYLELFKNDNTEWSAVEFAILNELFGDVDSFCADPMLRDNGDLDEYMLKKKCLKALNKLNLLNNICLNKIHEDYYEHEAIAL
ncbi:hypothetical protein GMMP15_190035 [Candidatus Magnetomoraceae bacterium gMMP-15]